MASTNDRVKIGGNVSQSQIAVGSYILQIGDVNGGVVNIAAPAAASVFENRTRPVSLRPRPFPSMLDREAEIDSIKSALSTSNQVNLYGELGIGKTTLIRQIAHTPETKRYVDGVVYLMVRGQGLEDILQLLFDSFYTYGAGNKPTAGQMRQSLTNIRALIFLDDISLARENTSALLDAMPLSIFVLSSEVRSLWGEGQAVAVAGLPESASISLFERELGRSISEKEQPLIRKICLSLKGHPLRILQTAALVREGGKSLEEIYSALQSELPDKAVIKTSLDVLDKPQQRILAVLGALGGAMVSIDHLASLVLAPETEKALKGLISLSFIQVDGSRYGLAGSLSTSLAQVWDLAPWDDALIKHFGNWIIQNPGQDLLEDAAEALLRVIQKAGEKNEWPEVVRLGKALERVLIFKKRWQEWADILNLILKAARALSDRKLEAWVLHQLGSRAMCLELADSARQLLTQALDIRKAIGDQAGLQLSQHNLNVLLKLPLAGGRSSGCRRCLTCGAVGAGGALLLLIAGIILASFFSPQIPPPVSTPVFTDTYTPLPPHEDTPTFTASATPSPAITFTPTITNTPEPIVLFDFIANADKAEWQHYVSDADGGFSEPIKFVEKAVDFSPEDYVNGQELSYAGWEEKPPLEDDSFENLVVLAYPYGSFNSVSGRYDLRWLQIENQDQLVIRVGFKNVLIENSGSTSLGKSDGVDFLVSFEDASSEEITPIIEIYDLPDGQSYEKVIDLNTWTGHTGWFILQVDALSTSTLDYAVWMDAALQRRP